MINKKQKRLLIEYYNRPKKVKSTGILTDEEKDLQHWKDLLCEMIQREAYLGVSILLDDKLRELCKKKEVQDLRTEGIN